MSFLPFSEFWNGFRKMNYLLIKIIDFFLIAAN